MLSVKQLMTKELLRLICNCVWSQPSIRTAVERQVERPGLYSLTTSEIGQTAGWSAIWLRGVPTVVAATEKAVRITQKANLRGVCFSAS